MAAGSSPAGRAELKGPEISFLTSMGFYYIMIAVIKDGITQMSP